MIEEFFKVVVEILFYHIKKFITSIFMKNISVSKFIVLISLMNMTIYYFPFYKYVFSNLNIFSLNGLLTFFTVLISIFTVTLSILFLLAIISPKVVKIFSIFMMLVNSIALYFILTYHIILDKTMMGNIFNTNTAEAVSYYHPKLFLYLLFLGIFPAYIISKIHIEKPKKIYLVFQFASILVVGILLLYLNSGTWLWLDKHAKKMGALAMPWSYTINAIRYKVQHLRNTKNQVLLPDAKFYRQ